MKTYKGRPECEILQAYLSVRYNVKDFSFVYARRLYLSASSVLVSDPAKKKDKKTHTHPRHSA
jgi:arginyl-tRNA--protein-N-Asp/Glu arginylyltransferase